MGKYKLCVCEHQTMRIDTDGEWDNTYESSYGWYIEDEEEVTIKGGRGYATFEAAEEAGEKKLKSMEEK